VRVAASAALIATATVAVGASAGGGFEPYPTIAIDTGPPFAGLAIAVVALALAPLVGARARMGVARA
jgi:hypothetical protein